MKSIIFYPSIVLEVFWGETEREKTDLITVKNSRPFLWKKNAEKNGARPTSYKNKRKENRNNRK